MKKLASILALLSTIFSICVPTVLAAKDASLSQYGTIAVEFSDNDGNIETLDAMVLGDDFYVRADQLGLRLGYAIRSDEANVVIYNKQLDSDLPYTYVQFTFGTTDVHSFWGTSYQAPCKAIKDEQGMWVPFEYTLLMLNSSLLIVDDVATVTMPERDLMDEMLALSQKTEEYTFAWDDDFGYTETETEAIAGISHVINVFRGALDGDIASWSSLALQFFGKSTPYDSKYGEKLAMLICTDSDEEFSNSIKEVKDGVSRISGGSLGKMLDKVSTSDEDIGTLTNLCNQYLEEIKAGNSSATYMYNQTYNQLEKALGEDTLFSAVKEQIKPYTTLLDWGLKVAEVVGYASDYTSKEEFALNALKAYLRSGSETMNSSEATVKALEINADLLSSNIAVYSLSRFLENNLYSWIKSGLHLSDYIGTQGSIVLLAWEIASNHVPFIKNGLSAADKFELGLYATVLQFDAYTDFADERRDIMNRMNENIDSEEFYYLAQICYIYLKNCYVTRDAALATLENRTSDVQEKIEDLKTYQNSINTEIAEHLATLKTATEDNDGLPFGFLVEDNNNYLEIYDASKLIEIFKAESISAQTGDILPGLYIGSTEAVNNGEEDFLVVDQTAPFSAWWENMESTVTFDSLNGNVASFTYYEPELITGTVEFKGNTATMTVNASRTSTSVYTWLRESYLFTNAQLKQMAADLNVPDNLDVQFEQGTPYYWYAGECWLLHVDVKTNEETVAYADFDFLTGEIMTSIYTYSPSQSVSASTVVSNSVGNSVEYK